MELISYIRENALLEMEQEEAIDKAVNRCIEEGYLESYLRQHSGEAKGMLLSGFDEEIYEKGLREEGRQEGKREGQTVLAKAISLIRHGKTMEDLLALGIDKETIDLAKQSLEA